MSLSLILPVVLERLSPEARSWVIAESAKRGESVEKVAREVIEAAARRDGFVPPQPEKIHAKAA